MMDGGGEERIYFCGPMFIGTEAYLAEDLNRGSRAEEAAKHHLHPVQTFIPAPLPHAA